MAVEFKGEWKRINQSEESDRMRAERVRDEKVQADFDRKPTLKQFVTGMKEAADGAEKIRTPEVPPAGQRSDAGDYGAKVREQEGNREKAKTRAEEKFIEVRDKGREFQRDIVKPRGFEEGPRQEIDRGVQEGAKTKKGTEADGRVAERPADLAGKINQHAAPAPEKGVKKEEKGQAAEKAENAADKKRAAPEKDAKDIKKGADDAKDAPSGDGKKHISAHAGTIAAGIKGVKQETRTEDEQKDKTVRSKDKGKSVSRRTAPLGLRDVQATTAELEGLLKGGGDASPETPSDALPSMPVDAPADTPPVEWSTGGTTYTNIPELAKSEDVRAAAVEHRQRTEKPKPEKVKYENWEPSKSVWERFVTDPEGFVTETEELLTYARQIIEGARLPKDPRDFGTHC